MEAGFAPEMSFPSFCGLGASLIAGLGVGLIIDILVVARLLIAIMLATARKPGLTGCDIGHNYRQLANVAQKIFQEFAGEFGVAHHPRHHTVGQL